MVLGIGAGHKGSLLGGGWQVTFATGSTISLKKNVPWNLEAPIEPEDVDARIRAGEMFSAESGVRGGDDIALPKRAVEFVQSGRAEGSVDGSRPGNIGINLVQQSHTRTEGIIAPVGKIDTRRGTG